MKRLALIGLLGTTALALCGFKIGMAPPSGTSFASFCTSIGGTYGTTATGGAGGTPSVYCALTSYSGGPFTLSDVTLPNGTMSFYLTGAGGNGAAGGTTATSGGVGGASGGFASVTGWTPAAGTYTLTMTAGGSGKVQLAGPSSTNAIAYNASLATFGSYSITGTWGGTTLGRPGGNGRPSSYDAGSGGSSPGNVTGVGALGGYPGAANEGAGGGAGGYGSAAHTGGGSFSANGGGGAAGDTNVGGGSGGTSGSKSGGSATDYGAGGGGAYGGSGSPGGAGYKVSATESCIPAGVAALVGGGLAATAGSGGGGGGGGASAPTGPGGAGGAGGVGSGGGGGGAALDSVSAPGAAGSGGPQCVIFQSP